MTRRSLVSSSRTIITVQSGFLCLMMLAGAAAAQEPSSRQLVAAPRNPAFVEYWSEANASARMRRAVTASGRALGVEPSPVDYSHLGREIPRIQMAAPLPSSYDLRTAGGVNRLTPVRDQGKCGACWTFSAMASAESSLMPGEARDFSENNMNTLNGFDGAACAGGNGAKASAYLARWSGPVNATDDPYDPQNKTPTSPAGLPVQKHVQNINIYAARASATANDVIKNAVMTDGAVDAQMRWEDASYNVPNSAYYYTGTDKVNHGVALVGWDDNFAASKFKTAPPGNGAFLVRNSWGSDWGQGGYFWISYYDARFLSEVSYTYVASAAVTNYSRKYEYDPWGEVGSMGLDANTISFANIFTAAATEQLAAVSFWAQSNNTDYSVSVYTNVTSLPNDGTLAGAATTGRIAVAGYHTIALGNLVQLTVGRKFSVVVRVTTPSTNSPIPVQQNAAGFLTKATGASGRSFGSADGVTWSDITANDPDASICLKAFTSAGSTQGSYPLVVNSASPAYGVKISVNPPDTAGKSDDSTSFTRSYAAGAGPIVLKAPDTSNGVAFGSWTGCDITSGTSCTIRTMNAARAITANYAGNNKTVPANTVPLIETLSPATVKAGGKGFYLTVNGSGFGSSAGAGVIWNKSDRTAATSWVDDTQLVVAISADDIAAEGTVDVAVSNPAVGGGTSTAVQFQVDSAGNSISVSADQASVTIVPGETVDVPVSITGGGSNPQVAVKCLNLPAGVTCGCGSGVLTIVSTEDTVPGTYPLIAAFSIVQSASAVRHGTLLLALWTVMATLPIGALWIRKADGRKRLLRSWLVLAGLLLLLTLAACGGSSGQSASTSGQTAKSSLPLKLMVVELE